MFLGLLGVLVYFRILTLGGPVKQGFAIINGSRSEVVELKVLQSWNNNREKVGILTKV